MTVENERNESEYRKLYNKKVHSQDVEQGCENKYLDLHKNTSF